MEMKFMIGILVVVAVLGIFAGYSADASSQTDYDVIESNVTLNVTFKDPVSISTLANEIKTQNYYKGYDNATLKWIESLKGKYAFFGDDCIVIMDKMDAKKIPSSGGIGVADVQYYEIFSCDVLANESLGNAAGPDNVLFVNNVTFIKQEEVYFEV